MRSTQSRMTMMKTGGFTDLQVSSHASAHGSHTFRPTTSRPVLSNVSSRHNASRNTTSKIVQHGAITERKSENVAFPTARREEAGPIVLVPPVNSTPSAVINVLAHITTNWMKAPQPANTPIQPAFDVFTTHDAFETFGSIQSYLMRLQSRLGVNEQVFIPVAIYIDRFVKATKFHITSSNIHKLLATSVLLAMKFWETWNRRNSSFGRVAELEGKVVNKLEFVFFRALGFSLFISNSDFDKYRAKIQQYARIHK